MAHVCKNHPETITRKRCHHCRTFICPECTRSFLDRPFCSTRCLIRSLLLEATAFWTTPTGTKPKSKKGGSPAARATSWLFPLITLSLFLMIWLSLRDLAHEVAAWKQSTLSTPAPTAAVPDSLQDRSRIQWSQPQQARISENRITIVGEAADNISLSLLVNHELRAVTISKDGRFSFENVTVKAGDNELVVRGLDEHGHVSLLEKIITITGRPIAEITAGDFSRGPADRKHIALTFDGGSGNGSAEAILNQLADKKITCTFFLTGAFMKRYPDLVRRIVADGHEVGNHTWSHPRLTTVAQNRRQETLAEMSKEKLQQELKRTADYFTRLTGKEMAHYWRAPFGEHNREIRAWAEELGYTHVGWTVTNGQSLDALDWVADKNHRGYQTSEKILSRLLAFGRDSDTAGRGGIILMHLGSQRKDDPVHPILPALIDSLRDRGYEWVTISRMRDISPL